MDVLIYNTPFSFKDPSTIFDVAIRLKTWSYDATHTETYIGNGFSAASRNGLGVNTYPLRVNDLSHILRPAVKFDFDAALKWHKSCIGQKYDWKGLLVFTLAVRDGSNNKMYCSEHTHRMAKKGKYFPFGIHADADRTAPMQFEWTPVYDWLM